MVFERGDAGPSDRLVAQQAGRFIDRFRLHDAVLSIVFEPGHEERTGGGEGVQTFIVDVALVHEIERAGLDEQKLMGGIGRIAELDAQVRQGA